MSTESRLQCQRPTGRPQCPGGCRGGEGRVSKVRRHVALCGSVSGHYSDWLTCFSSPSACMGSNSILIVYVAGPHRKDTATSSLPPCLLFLSVSPLLSPNLIVSSLGLSVSPPFHSSPAPPLLFKGLDEGQVWASEGLCSTEGSVAPCAKVMLASRIVFYEKEICTKRWYGTMLDLSSMAPAVVYEHGLIQNVK